MDVSGKSSDGVVALQPRTTRLRRRCHQRSHAHANTGSVHSKGGRYSLDFDTELLYWTNCLWHQQDSPIEACLAMASARAVRLSPSVQNRNWNWNSCAGTRSRPKTWRFARQRGSSRALGTRGLCVLWNCCAENSHANTRAPAGTILTQNGAREMCKSCIAGLLCPTTITLHEQVQGRCIAKLLCTYYRKKTVCIILSTKHQALDRLEVRCSAFQTSKSSVSMRPGYLLCIRSRWKTPSLFLSFRPWSYTSNLILFLSMQIAIGHKTSQRAKRLVKALFT